MPGTYLLSVFLLSKGGTRMARKRMFDIEVLNQDSFLDLPMEAKALYFLLGMEADDEGFVSPKKVLRLYGGTDDSIKILICKGYLIPFESGVVVITDWKRNNYLDKTRIKETIYLEEKNQIYYDQNKEKYIPNEVIMPVKQMLNKSETNVKQMLNQSSIEESSIEENRIEREQNENTIVKTSFDDPIQTSKGKTSCEEVISVYNECCSNLPKVKVLTEKRKTSIRKFLKELTIEQLKEICQKANESSFLIGDNGRGWKADFDFIMRIDKASEILEGRFDNSDKEQNKPVSEEFKEKVAADAKKKQEELEASRTIDLSQYDDIIYQIPI